MEEWLLGKEDKTLILDCHSFFGELPVFWSSLEKYDIFKMSILNVFRFYRTKKVLLLLLCSYQQDSVHVASIYPSSILSIICRVTVGLVPFSCGHRVKCSLQPGQVASSLQDKNQLSTSFFFLFHFLKYKIILRWENVRQLTQHIPHW